MEKSKITLKDRLYLAWKIIVNDQHLIVTTSTLRNNFDMSIYRMHPKDLENIVDIIQKHLETD